MRDTLLQSTYPFRLTSYQMPTSNVVDRARIELAATALQVQHSAPELPAHAFFQGPAFYFVWQASGSSCACLCNKLPKAGNTFALFRPLRFQDQP